MIRTIPAILEPDVSIELPNMTIYFEDDAWAAANQLSYKNFFIAVSTMKRLKLQNQLDYICQKM
jgi:hypothetical protein